jgi:MFS family permease
MVIYVPLYLIEYIHFDWKEIGALFTIMLLPFVLFEIPAGWISDKKLGEQEMMIGGFLIATGAIVAIPFLHNAFLSWAVVLFISRVGASLVEVTTESYFFKKIGAKDSDLLSIFRMTRSVSYLVTPAIVVVTFLALSFQYSFLILALITLSGILFASRIRDTK